MNLSEISYCNCNCTNTENVYTHKNSRFHIVDVIQSNAIKENGYA